MRSKRNRETKDVQRDNDVELANLSSTTDEQSSGDASLRNSAERNEEQRNDGCNNHARNRPNQTNTSNDIPSHSPELDKLAEHQVNGVTDSGRGTMYLNQNEQNSSIGKCT